MGCLDLLPRKGKQCGDNIRYTLSCWYDIICAAWRTGKLRFLGLAESTFYPGMQVSTRNDNVRSDGQEGSY
jgi:hypothetical protein